MLESKQQELSSISRSRTIEEMAAFWDTHDTADYWEQFEEVEIDVTMKPRHCVGQGNRVLVISARDMERMERRGYERHR